MIIRREFFKKVLIASIFALQLTVTGPVYNALAVGPDTEKAPVEDSIPSNLEVDKEMKEIEKVVSEKDKIYEEAEKAKRDEEFRKTKNMIETEEATETCKKADEATKAKSTEIDEKSKDQEKDYNKLIDQYFKDIDDKEQEIKSIKKKYVKINLDLKSDKATKEEKQSLQEELNNLTELNERLIIDISKTLEKINKVLSEKNQTNQKAEVHKEISLCNIM